MGGFADREKQRGSVVAGMIQNQKPQAQNETVEETPKVTSGRGRKKSPDLVKKQNLTLYLPVDLIDDVEMILFVKKDKMSSVVTNLLEGYVKENKNILDIMKQSADQLSSLK